MHSSELYQLMVSTISTNLYEKIKEGWNEDKRLVGIIEDLKKDPKAHKSYTWKGGQLKRKGKLVIGDSIELKDFITSLMHDSPQAGHSGVEVTYHKIK